MGGLEAFRVGIVDPPDISACLFCGARPRGDGMAYVSYDNNPQGGEDVPAGLIESFDRRAGRHAYRARDGYGRGVSTLIVEMPQVCGDCLAQGGALLGFGDLTPLQAELDEARAELARVSAERDQALAEREDADQAVRALRAFERISADPKRTRSKAAA